MAVIALLFLFGDVIVQRDGPAILTWDAPSAAAEGLALRFKERVTLTISVVGDGAIEVRLPDKLIKTPGWREAERSKPTIEKAKDGNTLWRQRVLLEPLAPVDSVLQAEPVKYRIGAGDWQSASTAPVAIHILTKSTDDVPRDITGPETMRPIDPDRLDWRLPTLVAVALGMVVLVFFLRRRQRVLASPTRALEELRRLEALDLPEQGKSERHCTLLAGLLRRFLDRRYGLPARRRTTEETIEAARRATNLQRGDVDFLRMFLPACDNAKFAPIELAPAEARRLTEELRRWLGERG